MIELNSKQRKTLEKLAHNVEPVVIVGGSGVTDGLISKVEESLKAHELIKIKFNDYKDQVADLVDQIVEKTNSTKVRIIGYVAILYREAEEADKRKIKF